MCWICARTMLCKFKHPFTAIIAGPSGCGKTHYTISLINALPKIVDTEISSILWCYSEENSLRTQDLIVPEQRQKIRYHKGMPESFENTNDEPMLIVIDDMMNEATSTKICDLFTKGSHHNSQSVLLISQNVFHHGSCARDISLNAKYIIVFKNMRDQLQFRYLARQLYPDHPRELSRIYREATAPLYSYLLIDLTPNVHDALRFRTDIFNENYTTVYVPLANHHLEHETINEMQAYAVCTAER